MNNLKPGENNLAVGIQFLLLALTLAIRKYLKFQSL